MAAWLPVLLEALTESAALVQWPLFGFSTQVHPVTRAELAAGRFRSTLFREDSNLPGLRYRNEQMTVILRGDVLTMEQSFQKLECLRTQQV